MKSIDGSEISSDFTFSFQTKELSISNVYQEYNSPLNPLILIRFNQQIDREEISKNMFKIRK